MRFGAGHGVKPVQTTPGPRGWDPDMIPDMACDLRGPVDLIGNPVTSWGNRGSIGNTFATAIALNQPPRGSLNGHRTVAYDGHEDSTPYTGANGDWSFMHDGTGGTMFIIGSLIAPAGTRHVIDNLREVNTETGIGVQRISDDRVRFRMGNATGVLMVVDTSANDAWAGDAPFVMTIRTSTATFGGQNYQVRINGNTAVQGVFGAAASANAPDYPMTIGSVAGEGQSAPINLGEMFAYTSLLSGANVGLVEAWAAARYNFILP